MVCPSPYSKIGSAGVVALARSSRSGSLRRVIPIGPRPSACLAITINSAHNLSPLFGVLLRDDHNRFPTSIAWPLMVPADCRIEAFPSRALSRFAARISSIFASNNSKTGSNASSSNSCSRVVSLAAHGLARRFSYSAIVSSGNTVNSPVAPPRAIRPRRYWQSTGGRCQAFRSSRTTPKAAVSSGAE